MQPRDCGWWLGGAGLVALCVGCAQHLGITSAYAPPYAPPVYPQPNSPAQPVSYAAPVAAGPVVGPPDVVMGSTVPAAAAATVAGRSTPCPEACPDAAVAGSPVVVDGGEQTPPCPPGP